MRHQNSYQRGCLTFILYPTHEGSYVAGCKELCLIKEGKDVEHLRYKIMADAKNYIENVCSHKLGQHLLNQDLPKEIWDEFNKYRIKKINEKFQKWTENIGNLLKNKNLTTV